MNAHELASLMPSFWCIEERFFRGMTGTLRGWLAAGCPKTESSVFQARATMSGGKKRKDIAVLSLNGVLDHRMSLWMAFMGGTSTADFGATFDAVMDDESVKAVLIDINSPGGSYSGTPELATKIAKRRGEKPIIGISDTLAASAAYWVGSAVDRLFVTPSGDVGSVGVFSIHEDWSAALANEGVKVSIMRVPEFKAEGTPYEPATEAFIENEMGQLGRIYGEFVDAVAKNRGVTPSTVRETYGKGRVVDARSAVTSGMADGVATFDQVLSRMQAGKISSKQMAADFTDTPQLNASGLAVTQAKLKLRSRGKVLTK